MGDTQIYKHVFKKVNASDKIIDIGCGNGEFVNFLARKTGRRIVGMDISDEGFEKAEKRAEKGRISHLVECVKDDAHYMKFKNGEFSAATLLYTLHHIKKPVVALREIGRVIGAEGHLFLGDNIVKRSKDKGECYRFTKKELLQLLKDAGFRQRSLKMFGGDFLLIEAQPGQRS